MLTLLIVVIAVALIFDYINGFHDAANAIATSVSSRVLHIRTAVLLAGVFNIVGALAGTAVAKTISSGFCDPTIATMPTVLAALFGACAWNLITWWYGIPSSSSHALIGGLAGAVVAQAGIAAFNWGTLLHKVLIPLVLAPVLCLVGGLVVMILCVWLTRGLRYRAADQASRVAKVVAACFSAYSHGLNDAQKSMGIITLALLSFIAAGHALPGWLPGPGTTAKGELLIPFWVVMSCAIAIGLGTAAGGKRIIKTMGSKMARLNALEGTAADVASATVIKLASLMGIPLSTTHCINGAMMGVGAVKRLSAVRWGTASRIVIAWVVTLPASAAMSWLAMVVIRHCC